MGLGIRCVFCFLATIRMTFVRLRNDWSSLNCLESKSFQTNTIVTNLSAGQKNAIVWRCSKLWFYKAFKKNGLTSDWESVSQSQKVSTFFYSIRENGFRFSCCFPYLRSGLVNFMVLKQILGNCFTRFLNNWTILSAFLDRSDIRNEYRWYISLFRRSAHRCYRQHPCKAAADALKLISVTFRTMLFDSKGKKTDVMAICFLVYPAY